MTCGKCVHQVLSECVSQFLHFNVRLQNFTPEYQLGKTRRKERKAKKEKIRRGGRRERDERERERRTHTEGVSSRD